MRQMAILLLNNRMVFYPTLALVWIYFKATILFIQHRGASIRTPSYCLKEKPIHPIQASGELMKTAISPVLHITLIKRPMLQTIVAWLNLYLMILTGLIKMAALKPSVIIIPKVN